jgi:hypothetical protein
MLHWAVVRCQYMYRPLIQTRNRCTLVDKSRSLKLTQTCHPCSATRCKSPIMEASSLFIIAMTRRTLTLSRLVIPSQINLNH